MFARFAKTALFVTFLVVHGILSVPVQAVTFPEQLAPAELESLDADKELVAGPFTGAMVIPRGVRDSKDEKYGQPYHATCYVYAGELSRGNEAVRDYLRRFIIHVPEADGLPLARRVGRMLLLCYGENHTRLRFDHPHDEPTVDVWLTQKVGAGLSADTGGEEFANQIYLYDISSDRKPIEWAREIAHEYGHYALPGVGGFTAPEPWANGVLGERLFLKWIGDDLRMGHIRAEALPFVTPIQLAEYLSKQVDPLVHRVAHEGADMHLFGHHDAAGMDTYTSLVLYLDTVYGSKGLLDALASTAPLPGQAIAKSADFLRGTLDSLNSATEFTLQPPGRESERTEVFMVYLPRGEFIVSTEGPVRSWTFPADARGVHAITKADLVVAVSDWRKLTIVRSDTSETPVRLLFRRRGAEIQ